MKYKPTKTKIKIEETIYNDGTKKVEYIPMYKEDFSFINFLFRPASEIFCNNWKQFHNNLDGGFLKYSELEGAKKYIDSFLSEEKSNYEKQCLTQIKSTKTSYTKYP